MQSTSLKAGDLTRLKADLTLLLAALIWGSAFAAQRVAASELGALLFNGLRLLLGALVLLPMARSRWKLERRPLLWCSAAGVILAVASALQQAGLRYTTAGNAGFITGLYVVLIPLLLLVFWKRKITPLAWAAALLATAGIALLSGSGELRLAPGDGLELAGALMWALHVIVIGQAVAEVDVFQFAFGQFLVAGLLSLLASLLFESPSLSGIGHAWLPILYTGIFSVGAGYTLQASGQRYAPPTDAAILMSTELIFAALFGFLLLGEQLAAVQVLGCVLILAAILLPQIRRPAVGEAGHG